MRFLWVAAQCTALNLELRVFIRFVFVGAGMRGSDLDTPHRAVAACRCITICAARRGVAACTAK